jgi:hypothetical protein
MKKCAWKACVATPDGGGSTQDYCLETAINFACIIPMCGRWVWPSRSILQQVGPLVAAKQSFAVSSSAVKSSERTCAFIAGQDGRTTVTCLRIGMADRK